VIMTTNLNWRPPGVRHVRISFVPTVTGTMQNRHQAKNKFIFSNVPSMYLRSLSICAMAVDDLAFSVTS
jgi:hypothetical protein